MPITCPGPNCIWCTGERCNACTRAGRPNGKRCGHTDEERHSPIMSVVADDDEPAQNRVSTKPMPAVEKPWRARIEIDFASSDIGKAADFFEHIAATIRRRGRLVLVEPEDK